MQQPGYQAAFFVALLSTAMALGVALAHALELPNKLGSSGEACFTVQQIYRGWSLLGPLLLVELASIVSVAIMGRHTRRVLLSALVALLCLLGAQSLFWIFTFPVNAATHNWTTRPGGQPRTGAAVTRSSWKSRGSVTSGSLPRRATSPRLAPCGRVACSESRPSSDATRSHRVETTLPVPSV